MAQETEHSEGRVDPGDLVSTRDDLRALFVNRTESLALAHDNQEEISRIEAESHAKLSDYRQQLITEAISNPLNVGEQVHERVLTGIQTHLDYDNISHNMPVTIDDALTDQKLPLVSLERIRIMELNPFDEMEFLGAVAIASEVRGTPYRKKFADRAVALLRCEANNVPYIPDGSSEEEIDSFILIFKRNVLAQRKLQQLSDQGYFASDSADQTILHRPYVSQVGDPNEIPIEPLIEDEVPAIFPNDNEGEREPSDDVEFRALAIPEVSDRLDQLRYMSEIFEGREEGMTVKFFEAITPFINHSEGEHVDQEPTDPSSEDELEIERDDNDVQEMEGARESRYIVAEFTQIRPDGSKVIHAVAESPDYGNACYVLRGEILEEWNRVTGIELTWREVFGHAKIVARQFGSKRFKHMEASDVPKRVGDYLLQDEREAVLEAFNNIFSSDVALFDENMSPTRKNRLPEDINDAIADSTILDDSWTDIRDNGYRHAFTATELGSTQRSRQDFPHTPLLGVVELQPSVEETGEKVRDRDQVVAGIRRLRDNWEAERIRADEAESALAQVRQELEQLRAKVASEQQFTASVLDELDLLLPPNGDTES